MALIRPGSSLNRKAIAGAVTALLAGSGVVVGHHSASMFQEAPVYVRGTIRRYVPIDPHAMIEMEEKLQDGRIRRWIVEGPRLARLERILDLNGDLEAKDFLGVGDAITVCGFALKAQFDPKRMYDDWQPVEGRFVHGQMLLLPDGKRQSWGPYGKLDNCVRSGDRVGDWVAFLDGNALARQQWCDSLTYDQLADTSPQALVASISKSLAMPCR